ncbi:MAG: pilus assembly protein [Gemmataceae bacterium]|nr:pilus assembly protein [Gemmataceae bacterium]
MLLLRPRCWPPRGRRAGATVVEFALIGPMLLVLVLGFAVLATGVYRYQQIAYLAREGTRYASTHGAQYRADNRLPPGDQATWTQEIRDQAILPQSTALNPQQVTVTASWSTGNNQANAGASTTSFQSTTPNTVTVTVTYRWVPEAFIPGYFILRSTATAPMAY